jgi:hypothetical protein
MPLVEVHITGFEDPIIYLRVNMVAGLEKEVSDVIYSCIMRCPMVV